MSLGAAAHRRRDLLPHERRRLRPHHRSQCGSLLERRAQHVLPGQIDESVEEVVPHLLVDVDPLDAAAALPRVEEGAVYQVLDGVRHVDVGPDVGRVLAAELEADIDEPAGRRFFHRFPAGHRAGEAHHVGHPACDDVSRLRVAQHEMLEHSLRQLRPVECLLKPLGDEQRRGGVLQHHRVACHDRRDDRVDGSEVGVVPWREREDHTERLARHIADEAILRARVDVGQRLLRDPDHVAGSLLEAAQLTRTIANRSPHLPRELGHDLVLHGDHRVHRGRAIGGPLGHRHALPLLLCRVGRRERCGDLLLAGNRPAGVDPAIDR